MPATETPMEFIDIAMLSAKPPLVRDVPSFEMLKALPRVRISLAYALADDPENLAALEATARISPVANVVKTAPPTGAVREDVFPRRLILEMTSVCNVLCRMCPRNDLRRPRMHMDAADCLRILREASEHGVEGVWTYHLGESLLHPQFRDVVRHMETLDGLGHVWMSTNGHLMTEDTIRFILDSRIDSINYSLHGVTAEAYAQIVPGGDFALVSANLERLIALKGAGRPKRPFIHLQMIDQQATHGEVEAFISKHRGSVETVSVNMLEYVNMPSNAYGYAQRVRPPRGHCRRVAKGDCFVCSNGAVTLCDAAYNCDERLVGELYLGSIHEQSLSAIWTGERRRRLLDLERAGAMESIPLCRTCTDYDF